MLSVLALSLVERTLNAALSTDNITQQQLSDRLDGKCLRVVCASPQLSVDVSFDAAKVRLEPTALGLADNQSHSIFEQRPYDVQHTVKIADCTLTVDNLIQLKSFTSDDFAGSVPVSGDMGVLQQLKRIIEQADINLASIFQPVLGASLTGQLSNVFSYATEHTKKRAQQAEFYAEEWLKEDNTVLAKRWQMEQTKSDIRTLRTDIEREHAKLDMLLKQAESRKSQQNSPD